MKVSGATGEGVKEVLGALFAKIRERREQQSPAPGTPERRTYAP
jgi:hypothetical protein